MVENFLRVLGRGYGTDRHNEDKKGNHDHKMNVSDLKVQEKWGEGRVSLVNFRRFPLPTFVDISWSDFRREPIGFSPGSAESKSATAVGETSFKIDFLANTKNRVGNRVAHEPLLLNRELYRNHNS